jgi:hypothetical protein
MTKERCPICHAEALYVGLEDLECPTPECPNYGTEPSRSGEQLRFELDQLMYELWCRARARL